MVVGYTQTTAGLLQHQGRGVWLRGKKLSMRGLESRVDEEVFRRICYRGPGEIYRTGLRPVCTVRSILMLWTIASHPQGLAEARENHRASSVRAKAPVGIMYIRCTVHAQALVDGSSS
jgi:hypothetical protein